MTTRSSLLKGLKETETLGYAVDLAEGLEGIHCVASVILDDYHYPVGAITIIAPAFRMPPERFEEMGKACIEHASQSREKLLA